MTFGLKIGWFPRLLYFGQVVCAKFSQHIWNLGRKDYRFEADQSVYILNASSKEKTHQQRIKSKKPEIRTLLLILSFGWFYTYIFVSIVFKIIVILNSMEGFIDMLPEECVSTILSFTCPIDTFRSSMVSSIFHSAAEADVVWERFLPDDYKDVVSRLVTPLAFTTKKELFLCLCNPVLIDGGRKVFLKWFSNSPLNIFFAFDIDVFCRKATGLNELIFYNLKVESGEFWILDMFVINTKRPIELKKILTKKRKEKEKKRKKKPILNRPFSLLPFFGACMGLCV